MLPDQVRAHHHSDIPRAGGLAGRVDNLSGAKVSGPNRRDGKRQRDLPGCHPSSLHLLEAQAGEHGLWGDRVLWNGPEPLVRDGGDCVRSCRVDVQRLERGSGWDEPVLRRNETKYEQKL